MNARASETGALIVAVGIPGCGKSTVFAALGRLLGAAVFHEPEERDWGAAVRERDICGRFTGITWFRAKRVPQLYQAEAIRRTGGVALVDSYYDKLLSKWLGKPGTEWLIDPSDPYYSITSEMATIDHACLPNADVVVSFSLEYETWRAFLERRGRALDQDPAFLANFPTQEYFTEAARQYCSERSTRLIEFVQDVSSPDVAAVRLSSLLAATGSGD